MKTYSTLSVAVVALIGSGNCNQQQKPVTPLSHTAYIAPIVQYQTHTLVQQQQNVVESKPPVSVSHVQLQQTQQNTALAKTNAKSQVSSHPNKQGLVATNADFVIYTKNHKSGGNQLDKEKDNKHITLTVVQDFPKKKPDQNQLHNVEMIQAHEQIHQQQGVQITSTASSNQKESIKVKTAVKQTSQVQGKVQAQVKANIAVNKKVKSIDEGLQSIDSNVAKKVDLTIVQDFRKKVAEKPPVNMELIEQKEKETLVVNENTKKFSTKKNKDKQTTLTIVQEFPKKKADQEKDKPPQAIEMINIKPEAEKIHPKHQSFAMSTFNMATDWLYKAFGFGN